MISDLRSVRPTQRLIGVLEILHQWNISVNFVLTNIILIARSTRVLKTVSRKFHCFVKKMEKMKVNSNLCSLSTSITNQYGAHLEQVYRAMPYRDDK